MLGIHRCGPHQARVVLIALIDARNRGQTISQYELIDKVSDQLGRRAARRTLRLLTRTGLITGSPAKTIVTNEHLWIEYDLTLTDTYDLLAPIRTRSQPDHAPRRRQSAPTRRTQVTPEAPGRWPRGSC
jgi:hypothetical protein